MNKLTKERNRELAKVYIKAARLIDDKTKGFCCTALYSASKESPHLTSDKWMTLLLRFKPDDCSTYDAWFGLKEPTLNRKRRILALLFCAAMAADGDE